MENLVSFYNSDGSTEYDSFHGLCQGVIETLRGSVPGFTALDIAECLRPAAYNTHVLDLDPLGALHLPREVAGNRNWKTWGGQLAAAMEQFLSTKSTVLDRAAYKIGYVLVPITA